MYRTGSADQRRTCDSCPRQDQSRPASIHCADRQRDVDGPKADADSDPRDLVQLPRKVLLVPIAEEMSRRQQRYHAQEYGEKANERDVVGQAELAGEREHRIHQLGIGHRTKIRSGWQAQARTYIGGADEETAHGQQYPREQTDENLK